MTIRHDDAISNGRTTYRADGSAPDTADLVTDEQIEALRAEARGIDDVQVLICTKALDGDVDARAECVRVIQAAQAMGD